MSLVGRITIAVCLITLITLGTYFHATNTVYRGSLYDAAAGDTGVINAGIIFFLAFVVLAMWVAAEVELKKKRKH